MSASSPHGALGKFSFPSGATIKHPLWLYVRRPVWRNLVTHDVADRKWRGARRLAPTRSRLFLQLDAGAYTEAGICTRTG